jgi:ABC-type Mn2+/Zn2+ transport system permease subunit
MLVKSWKARLVVGWCIATIASLAGLWASYKLDLPTGAAIVVACGVLLALISTVTAVRAQRVTAEPTEVTEVTEGPSSRTHVAERV